MKKSVPTRWSHVLTSLACAAFVVGCAITQASVERTPGVERPPSATPPKVVKDLPADGVEVAKISVTGNLYSNALDCEKRLSEEATKVGAEVLLVEHGSSLGSPTCLGRAYALKAR